MPRTITVTFADGSKHVYRNAPDNITPEQVSQRAQQDFGKQVQALDGGRKTAPKPAARPGVGTTALNSLAAVGGALWRGAAAVPDMLADAGEAVTDGIGNALGLPSTPKRNSFRLGDVPDKLGTPRPAGPGVEFAGNMLGGAVIPGPPAAKRTPKFPAKVAPKPATAAAQTVAAGKQAGVRVLTSDVKPPRTFVGKAARAMGERVPILGTGGVREAQQAERVAAVKSLLDDFGAVGADDAVDAVAGDLAKTRGAMLGKLTTAKTSVIQGIQGAVPVPQAAKAIDDQIAHLTGINAEAYAPVIAKLNEFKGQLASGKTLEQIEGNRKLLGDLFKDPSLAAIAGDGQKALNAIYGPLRADMGNFIKAQGGQAAFAKWHSANQQLAAMAGELADGTFKKVLSTTEATPENVARMLFSKKPSDVARLYSNLSGAGRAKAQASVLHKAMTDAGGFENISPDRFATAIDKLGRSAGVIFDPVDKARLDGLSRVLGATKRAAEAGVMTNSGQQAVPFLMGGAALAQPWLVGGGALLARAYESAPVRDALLKLGRTKAGSVQGAVQLGRAMNALTAALKPYAEEMATAANSNTLPALAADPEPEQQGEQQPPLQP